MNDKRPLTHRFTSSQAHAHRLSRASRDKLGRLATRYQRHFVFEASWKLSEADATVRQRRENDARQCERMQDKPESNKSPRARCFGACRRGGRSGTRLRCGLRHPFNSYLLGWEFLTKRRRLSYFCVFLAVPAKGEAVCQPHTTGDSRVTPSCNHLHINCQAVLFALCTPPSHSSLLSSGQNNRLVVAIPERINYLSESDAQQSHVCSCLLMSALSSHSSLISYNLLPTRTRFMVKTGDILQHPSAVSSSHLCGICLSKKHPSSQDDTQ